MNRLRQLRLSKNLKQKELAALLNTTQQAIGHYETGVRGLDAETICKICEVFGCTADYLLCRSDRQSPGLTPAEEDLLFAYNAATDEIRSIVDNSLARYKKDAGESTATG